MSKFKVGDTVKCINAGGNFLTKGKVYTVTGNMVKDEVSMLNDEGNERSYYENRFELEKRPVPDFKVELSRVGELATVTITGNIDKQRVAAILAAVYD